MDESLSSVLKTPGVLPLLSMFALGLVWLLLRALVAQRGSRLERHPGWVRAFTQRYVLILLVTVSVSSLGWAAQVAEVGFAVTLASALGGPTTDETLICRARRTKVSRERMHDEHPTCPWGGQVKQGLDRVSSTCSLHGPARLKHD